MVAMVDELPEGSTFIPPVVRDKVLLPVEVPVAEIVPFPVAVGPTLTVTVEVTVVVEVCSIPSSKKKNSKISITIVTWMRMPPRKMLLGRAVLVTWHL